MAIVIVAAKADRRAAEDLATSISAALASDAHVGVAAEGDVALVLLTDASAADAEFHAALAVLKSRPDVLALVGADPSPFDLGPWRMIDFTAWLDDPKAPLPDDVVDAIDQALKLTMLGGASEVRAAEPPPAPQPPEALRPSPTASGAPSIGDPLDPSRIGGAHREGIGAARDDRSLPKVAAPGVGAGAAPSEFKKIIDEERFGRAVGSARAPAPAPPSRARAQAPRKVLAALQRLDAHATAFAPKKLRRANAEMVQIIVHQPHQSAAVAQLAKKADPRAAEAGAPAALGGVETGARIRVMLDVRGGVLSDSNHGQVWTGEPLAFPFTVEASDDRRVGQVAITARVLADDAQIGLISFVRPIANARAKPEPHQKVDAKMRRAKRVFLSYSSKDRETVAMVAQAYASAGVPCFFDRTSLASGEEWSPRLLKEIERADLFHLFWSKNASASDWVAKEARHALTRRRKSWSKQPDITVQMLDGPPWAPHPADLDSINFDDFVRAAVVGYARGDG